MPSSTSNSNQRLPDLDFALWWRTCAVLLLLLLVGGEWMLRRAGHLRSLTDGEVLWSRNLDRIARNQARVALIGASQAQLGLSVDDFARQTGLATASLTIDGNSPIPVLAYVAERTDFRGVVLCDVLESHGTMPYETSTARKYLRFFNDEYAGGGRYNRLANQYLLNFLQRHLVFFSANVRLPTLLKREPPFYLETRPDRSRRAYYRDMVSPEKLAGRPPVTWPEVPDKEQRWRATAETLAGYVRRIQARGGQVVFVRFPRPWPDYDRDWPRARYWDVLLGITGAPGLHFMDEPTLQGYDLPDGTHLDGRDVQAFTRAFGEVFQRRGWADTRAAPVP